MNHLNRIFYLCYVIILCLLIPFTIHAQPPEKSLTFAMFAPRKDSFWPKQEAFMQAACQGLNIQCIVYYSDDNQFEMKRQIELATTGPNKVDAVIFHNYKQQGLSFIQIANNNNVASFLINTPLTEHDYQIAGKPREKYTYWLGEMIPDDEFAGFLTASKIIAATLNYDSYFPGKSGKKVHMIAINGTVSDGATIEREKGLRRALKANHNTILYQYFTTRDWSLDDATSKYIGALKRYPHVNAIWAGDDDIALAIIKKAKKLHLTAGKDYFIAGIGWSGKSIDAIKNGELIVDVGGHFLEAAWATILLYDYFHGIDFQNEGFQMRSPMFPIYKNNIDDITSLFYALKENRIDFTSFSKFHHPELTHYQFQLNKILQQAMK